MTTPKRATAPRRAGLALCLRLYATLARAAVLLGADRERAGRLLEVARAVVEEPDVPLAPDLLRELRRLLDDAARSADAGDIVAAESSTAVAEALCLAGMLRPEPPPADRGEG